MLTRRTLLAATAASLLPLPAFAMPAAAAFERAAFEAAQASGKSILVEIHATWCGTCKIQSVVLKDLLKKDAYKAFVVLRVDFDDQKPEVKAFGADMQSTLIVYKGKTEMARVVGATGNEALDDLLKTAI